MICPVSFGYNEQTASNNDFMQKSAVSSVQDLALKEFEAYRDLLLKNDRYPEEKILSGMDTTAKKFAFSEDVINIQPIDRTPEHLHSYVNKELTADKNGNFNSFCIILSSDMFNLPVKQSIQSHKPSVVAPNNNRI